MSENFFDFDENLKNFFSSFYFCFILSEKNINFAVVEIENKIIFKNLVNFYFSYLLIYENICNKKFVLTNLLKLENFLINFFKDFFENLENLFKTGEIFITNKSDFLLEENKIFVKLKFNSEEYLIKDFEYDLESRKFVANKFFRNFLDFECLNLLSFCFAKRDVFKENKFLVDILGP